MKVSDFHYELPEHSIGQTPAEPRHVSRLLDSRDMTDHQFIDLPDLLAPEDLLVVNETMVRAARLKGIREGTGGRVELLLLERRPDDLWDALARPARKLKPGMVIDVDGLRVEVMSEARDGVVTISLDADDPEEAVRRAGVVPLPPYFTGRLEEGGRYQTMFANRPGSSAAPTAGLHFTEAVMQRVRSRGIGVARVDLHVSLDTFRPMTVENVEDHVIHSEWCSIPMETALAIDKARTAGGRIVAVGTTVVRTLESMADSSGGVRAGEGPTDLFLKPGSRFSIVDVLVTNFHMPSSTLLVLLAAFMGEGWRHVYETALLRGYRFLSFGDAMLCVRG